MCVTIEQTLSSSFLGFMVQGFFIFNKYGTQRKTKIKRKLRNIGPTKWLMMREKQSGSEMNSFHLLPKGETFALFRNQRSLRFPVASSPHRPIDVLVFMDVPPCPLFLSLLLFYGFQRLAFLFALFKSHTKTILVTVNEQPIYVLFFSSSSSSFRFQLPQLRIENLKVGYCVLGLLTFVVVLSAAEEHSLKETPGQ